MTNSIVFVAVFEVRGTAPMRDDFVFRSLAEETPATRPDCPVAFEVAQWALEAMTDLCDQQVAA